MDKLTGKFKAEDLPTEGGNFWLLLCWATVVFVFLSILPFRTPIADFLERVSRTPKRIQPPPQ